MPALLEAIMNAKHANLTPNGRGEFITPPTPACCSTSRSPATTRARYPIASSISSTRGCRLRVFALPEVEAVLACAPVGPLLCMGNCVG
jgi:hypothetical protein